MDQKSDEPLNLGKSGLPPRTILTPDEIWAEAERIRLENFEKQLVNRRKHKKNGKEPLYLKPRRMPRVYRTPHDGRKGGPKSGE
jgi:hypothetical protein